MVHQIFIVLAALCCCFRNGVMAKEDKDQHPRELPCPPAADIQPCICTVLDITTYDIEMDCSSITNNEELARIFSGDFPYDNFYSLVIENNNYLRIVRAGDLGEKSFQEISITSSSLETVERNAFMASYNTLTNLEITNTNLVSFPFDEILWFTHLYTLNLPYNKLVGSPELSSSTLRNVYLNDNPISGVLLNSLPYLDTIYLYRTEITHIFPGTFTNLPRLDYINLSFNGLQVLEAGVMNLQDSYTYVYLHNNALTFIAEGALMGLNGGVLSVENNQLTELAEAVFRPVMDENVDVRASGNPLACGCEIAWLVTNPTYVSLLDSDASCTSGQLVSDLDPHMFEVMCS